MKLEQASFRVLRFSPVNIILPLPSIPIYHKGDEQKTRWWLQFEDIVSVRRHEQQQQPL